MAIQRRNKTITLNSGDALAVKSGATLDVQAGATVNLPAGSIPQAEVAPASLDGTVAKVAADLNVIGAIPLIFRVALAAGALANTDVIMTHKVRVINAWLHLDGAGVATTTIQVKNGTAAITDAMAASGSDEAIVRCASIDDAAHEIAAGGTLRITSATGATQPAATVYVEALRVA